MANLNINTNPIVSSVNDSDTLHITTGGSLKRLEVSTLIAKAKADCLTEMEANLLNRITDGCKITTHRKSDNIVLAYSAASWAAKQNAGEVADGVLITGGGKYLVVAPTQAPSKLYWSSAATSVGAAVTDRLVAIDDWDGKNKTAAILADATIGGDGSGYAPGFCAAYSCTNGVDYTGNATAANRGFKAGRWWLPSMGELMMIWANRFKVNACLELIAGATTLSTNDAYWSSTENSAANAWGLNFGVGLVGNITKVSNARYVRAVTAFVS